MIFLATIKSSSALESSTAGEGSGTPEGGWTSTVKNAVPRTFPLPSKIWYVPPQSADKAQLSVYGFGIVISNNSMSPVEAPAARESGTFAKKRSVTSVK